jgi:hypothetical protein
MISDYPAVVQQVFPRRRVRQLSGSTYASALDPDDVIREIQGGRPIIAGVSPSGMQYPPDLAEHVVLVVGFEDIRNGLEVIVNDPFPYIGFNPYLNAGGRRIRGGQYKIQYDAFVSRVGWSDTIYEIAEVED